MENNISNQDNTAIESNTPNQNIFHLLDGTPLIGYPKHPSSPIEDNSMQLDKTRQNLTMGNKNPKPQKPNKNKDLEIFTKHAFLFFDNRDRILSDSRMFLAPVKIQSGLAYAGTGGFNNPVLGVYIEWWMTCGPAIVDRYSNMPWLIYRISGSPLSGSNKCGIVNQIGVRESTTILPFSKLWKPFVSINNRYSKAKTLYEAYTLQEVVDQLASEETDSDNTQRMLFLMQHEIRTLQEELKEKEQCHKRNMENMRKNLLTALFDQKRDQLKQWYMESGREHAIQKKRLEELLQQKEQLRKR